MINLVVKFKQMVPIGSESFRRISVCRRAPNVRSVPLERDLGAQIAANKKRASGGNPARFSHLTEEQGKPSTCAAIRIRCRE